MKGLYILAAVFVLVAWASPAAADPLPVPVPEPTEEPMDNVAIVRQMIRDIEKSIPLTNCYGYKAGEGSYDPLSDEPIDSWTIYGSSADYHVTRVFASLHIVIEYHSCDLGGAPEQSQGGPGP